MATGYESGADQHGSERVPLRAQGAGRLCRYRVLLETAHISRKVLTIFLFDFVCMFVCFTRR